MIGFGMITLQDVINLYLALTSKYHYSKYALQMRVEFLMSKLQAILIVVYVSCSMMGNIFMLFHF